jgi:hypothetical protein
VQLNIDVLGETFIQFFMILEVTYYNVDGTKAVTYKIILTQLDV